MASRLLFVLYSVFLSAILYGQAFSDYKIIGNTTGVTQLTQAQAKSYFKGKYTLWGNGKSVKVVLHSSESTQAESIATLIFGTTHKGVKKYWLSLVFQGRANPPIFYGTDSEIVEYIKKTPGAIGIIQKGSTCPAQYVIQIQ